jgi:hypothetical protein
MRRAAVRALALATLAVLLTGCEPVASDRPAPGPTRFVTPRQGATPNPNPDKNVPQPPARTPGPVNGDPTAHSIAYNIVVTCSPGADFVDIEWSAGRSQGGKSQRMCQGGFQREGRVWQGERLNISAEWTELSYRSLGRKSIIGTITVSIALSAGPGCRQETPPYGRPRGAACATKA